MQAFPLTSGPRSGTGGPPRRCQTTAGTYPACSNTTCCMGRSQAAAAWFQAVAGCGTQPDWLADVALPAVPPVQGTANATSQPLLTITVDASAGAPASWGARHLGFAAAAVPAQFAGVAVQLQPAAGPLLRCVPQITGPPACSVAPPIDTANVSAPDVMLVSGEELGALLASEESADLTHVVQRDRAIQYSGLLPAFEYSLYRMGGSAAALPLAISAQLLYFSRSRLAAANLTPPRTWAELLAAASSLHKPVRTSMHEELNTNAGVWDFKKTLARLPAFLQTCSRSRARASCADVGPQPANPLAPCRTRRSPRTASAWSPRPSPSTAPPRATAAQSPRRCR